ncbi:MAG: winged helix-turn-helix transcriptional regulator [Chloroflexi bacterium]|nr:winged helix-turn-helix transcriptional regulator [Chloroflexota bacterium]
MLEYLFSSKARIKLLTRFLSDPEAKLYTRQLERELGEPVNAVRRELERFEALGLLQSFKEGNLKYYTVNREFSIYPELRGIILKAQGMPGLVQPGPSALASPPGHLKSEPTRAREMVVGETD